MIRYGNKAIFKSLQKFLFVKSVIKYSQKFVIQLPLDKIRLKRIEIFEKTNFMQIVIFVRIKQKWLIHVIKIYFTHF